MTFDLLRRIRWTNVARAAAVALALLLALAWPRYRAHEDTTLPPAIEPAPAVVAPATPAAKTSRARQHAREEGAEAPRVSETKTPQANAVAPRGRMRAASKQQAARRRAKRHRHARHRNVRPASPAGSRMLPTSVYVPPAVAAEEFRP